MDHTYYIWGRDYSHNHVDDYGTEVKSINEAYTIAKNASSDNPGVVVLIDLMNPVGLIRNENRYHKGFAIGRGD